MPAPQRSLHLQRIIEALNDARDSDEGGLGINDLAQAIGCIKSERTFRADLAEIERRFPTQFVKTAGQSSGGRPPCVYSWRGPLPQICEQPLTHLNHEELLALKVARDMLRNPHHEDGPLVAALDRLIAHAGSDSHDTDKQLVTVSRFAALAVEDSTFQICAQAMSDRRGLRFTYTKLDGFTYQTHVRPLRLVFVKGEWYLMAWSSGQIKMRHLGRIADDIVLTDYPKGCPHSIRPYEIEQQLEGAFYATGGEQRTKVVLAVSPDAYTYLGPNRTWGLGQTWDDEPKDLPEGWRRLSFITTGSNEVRFWILSYGASVRIEQPEWMAEFAIAHAREVLAARATSHADG